MHVVILRESPVAALGFGDSAGLAEVRKAVAPVALTSYNRSQRGKSAPRRGAWQSPRQGTRGLTAALSPWTCGGWAGVPAASCGHAHEGSQNAPRAVSLQVGDTCLCTRMLDGRGSRPRSALQERRQAEASTDRGQGSRLYGMSPHHRKGAGAEQKREVSAAVPLQCNHGPHFLTRPRAA